MTFKHNYLGKRVIWGWRAWPLWVTVSLICLHLYIRCMFPEYSIRIDKYTGMGMQIFGGGLLVLYAINENLGIFRNQTFLSIFKSWLQDYSSLESKHTSSISGNATPLPGRASGIFGSEERPAITVEERVTQLEGRFTNLSKSLDTFMTESQQNLEKFKAEFNNTASSHRSHIDSLAKRIEEVTLGSLKWKIFGVLLVIYGTSVSAL